MTLQTSILFDSDFVSRKQNSPENQAILESVKPKLNKQCLLLLEVLKTGRKLTVRDCMIEFGIGDGRARFRDLAKAGVDIQKEILEGGYKQYWIE